MCTQDGYARNLQLNPSANIALVKYGVIENSPAANFALPRSFSSPFFPLLAPWHGGGLRCRIACGTCARNVRAKEVHAVFWRITKVELMSPMVLQ